MDHDWVRFAVVIGGLFLGPTLVYVASPKSIIGALCGWFLALQPGLVLGLSVFAALRMDGLGWSVIYMPIIFFVLFLIFWIPFSFAIIDQAGAETNEDFDRKLEIYDRLIGVFTHSKGDEKDHEQDPDWDAINDLTGMPYPLYLKSNEWGERRAFMLERAEYSCEKCGSDSRLEIHHETYKRLGNERISDLTVLCHECHGLKHLSAGDHRVQTRG